MSEQKIENALTEQEWNEPHTTFMRLTGRMLPHTSRDAAALIALANTALPDSDPRKITREKVEAMREWIPGLNNHSGFRELAVLLHHHCNALASYLPPE